MATSGNTRTAYLVVTHPDTGAVKDVLTITQAQMAPPATTQAPAYNFNWIGSSWTGSTTTSSSTVAQIFFSWDGPNLTTSDFGFILNPSGMNGTGGGGGGGCLLEGTLITMMDGTSKKVEDVVVGDVVKSISIQGLSEDEDAWKSWSTNTDNFVSSNISPNITGLATEVFNKYYTLGFGDKIIHVTGEHPILIKKEDNTILFQQVRDIQVGDAMRVFSSNSWAVITSIDIITDNTIPTYNLSAEDADVYVAGDIIVHNVVDEDKDDGGSSGGAGVF